VRAWLFVASVLAAAVATAAVTEPEERELRRAIAEADRGMSALGKGNTKKAREAFDRSLAAVPDYPEGHLGLGHLAMRERRFEEALSEFRSAEIGYKAMSSIIVQMEADRYARSRDELQELRVTLAQIDEEIRRSQTRPSSSGSGSSYEGRLQRERAQQQARIQTLESMNPPSTSTIREAPAEILFFQGNALFNLKRRDEAIEVWEAARRRDPKQPFVENNLAVAYWMEGRLNDARAAMLRSEALGFKVNPSFRADLERALAATAVTSLSEGAAAPSAPRAPRP
jgi:tetratricopeptide (TPR) repeat protein